MEYMGDESAEGGMSHATDMIKKIRLVAKRHGWAIGVHGSLKRDIDLIAVPWTKYAMNWSDLWKLLAKKVPLWRGGYDLNKPHGRIACIMLKPGSEPKRNRKDWFPAQIDISFVPINQMRRLKKALPPKIRKGNVT